MNRRMLLAGLLNAALAAAEVRNLGVVSFAPPQGWRYEERGGSARMEVVDGRRHAGLSVHGAFRSSGDAVQDFRAAWNRILARSLRMAAPHMGEHRALAGYSGNVGCVEEGRFGVVCLYTLRFPANLVVPVVELFSSRKDVGPHTTVLRMMIDGIRVAPQRAEPVKTTIEISDLVGRWSYGSDSSLDWVDASGNFIVTSWVAHGTTYDIESDGSYYSRFAGIGNGRIVRSNERGRVEIRGDLIVFRNTNTNSTESYRWISTQTAPNGSKVITVLPGQYKLEAGSMMYAIKLLQSN